MPLTNGLASAAIARVKRAATVLRRLSSDKRPPSAHLAAPQSETIHVRRHTLGEGDADGTAARRCKSMVYASQYAHLRREEGASARNHAEHASAEPCEGMRMLKGQIAESRAQLRSRNSFVEEVVSVTTLRAQIEKTRSQLFVSASIASSLAAWQQRSCQRHAAGAKNDTQQVVDIVT